MDVKDNRPTDGQGIDDAALDALAVAPPRPPATDDDDAGDEDAEAVKRATPDIREGLDAGHSKTLRDNPSDDSCKLDIALDESFPTSDAPSNTQPGKGKDPAPSSGFDAAAEADRGNDTH